MEVTTDSTTFTLEIGSDDNSCVSCEPCENLGDSEGCLPNSLVNDAGDGGEISTVPDGFTVGNTLILFGHLPVDLLAWDRHEYNQVLRRMWMVAIL